MDEKTIKLDEISELIDSLKQKQRYGVIIETGAGSPLYNELCKRPNTASKLVYYSLSPTSWDYTKLQYPVGAYRAVSRETCEEILLSEIQEHQSNQKINYIFCNSIQVGNDALTQTHGWVGYAVKKEDQSWWTYYYHFSIDNEHYAKNRVELVKQIKEICLDLFLNEEQPTTGYIDIIYSQLIHHDLTTSIPIPDNKALLEQKLLSKLSNKYGDDQYICFKEGKPIRLNDLLRNSKKNIVLYKGAFNPIHPEHINMVNGAVNQIPESEPWLMISVQNRDANKKIDVNNLLSRISLLSSFGYTVIINTLGLFFYSNLHFKDHIDFKDKKLYQLMGDDTLIRLIDDDGIKLAKEFKDITILVKKRKYKTEIAVADVDIKYLDHKEADISSTDIRKLITEQKFDVIITEYGVEYFNMLKTYYIQK